METSCPRCGAAAGAGARFCATCGAPLEVPELGERKIATLVFADLVGSTELIRGRDPEEARRLLAPFFELARTTLEEHGGRVEKYIGDAVVAVFGVPRAHGDDPDRAVAAALSLVGRLRERNSELAVRIGVETGEVLASPRGGDLSVTGEAAHAAARLQQAAAPGEVLLGARAAAACRAVRLEKRAAVEAKGFAEPLRAWHALGIAPPADSTETPFLGRGGELESLRLAYLAAVRERSPRLALVVGDAGAGKSRLGRELLASLAESEPRPTVLVGRNPPYGDGIAFWALAEILRAAAGAPRGAGSAEVEAALAARLTELQATHAQETAGVLAATLAGNDGAGVSDLRRAWRRMLTTLSADTPVVVAIDDAHWADEGFLDLVDDALSLPGCPLLVFCTARPEIGERRPGFGDGIRRERLELAPLAPAAVQELAAGLVDDLELAHEIAAASGGNPFFAEEIARALGDGRAEDREGAMPDTVQAAIAARLDTLPPGEKRALQRAAVLGDRFRLEALGELLDEPHAAALDELESRALIESLDSEERGLYGFRHQLIRDVAYASLTRAERVGLHERAADGIRGRAGDRYPELAEVIAFHLASAAELESSTERAEAAFVATREAGALALRRSAPARAEELFEQAARFAPDTGSRIEVLDDASEIALGRLRGDHAFRLLGELGESAEEAGDPAAAARYYARATEVAARMSGISGTFDEPAITALFTRARELVPDPDPNLEALLAVDAVWVAWRFRQPDRLAPLTAKALELARGTGDMRLLSSALDGASGHAWTEGRFRDATALSRERVDALERLPRSGYLAFERSDALNMLTESLIYCGELRESIHWADVNAQEMSTSAPHIAGAVSLRPLYMLGEWDAALERGVAVRESWFAEGRPPISFFAPNLACVAAIHGLRGDEAEQRDWFRLAEEMATGNEQQLPAICMWEADVALHFSDHERAVGLLAPLEPGFGWRDPILAKRAEALALAGHPDARSTLELAESQPSQDVHSAAVALRARGVLERDDSVLAEACERFRRLECVPDLARTQWLRGGAHREPAAAAFEGLGAVPPG